MGLKEIRLAKGYPDQRALGALIGVDQSTAGRMEAYAPNTTLRLYIRAAEELGVSLAEIFSDDRTQAETILVRHWRSLPEKQRNLWAEQLRLAAGDDPEASE